MFKTRTVQNKGGENSRAGEGKKGATFKKRNQAKKGGRKKGKEMKGGGRRLPGENSWETEARWSVPKKA